MNNLLSAYEIERSLAGCCLISPGETIKVARLSPADFADDNARAIYEATVSLIDSGKPCDAAIIQAESGVTVEYCHNAMLNTPTTVNAPEYARLVHEAALQRKAMDIGYELASGNLSTSDALTKLQELTQSGKGLLTPQQATQQAMDIFSAAADGRQQLFVKTGFDSLDRMLSGGLVNGGMVTIAARPATGKTTVALNICENVTAAGKTVLYVSLEMPSAQLIACRAANVGRLNRSEIFSGEALKDESKIKQLVNAYETIYKRQFYIYDNPATVDDVERLARSIKALDLIVIDHIGLLRNPAKGTRYEVMTSTAHRIKQLALSLQIPVLSLCQLNRAAAHTDRPSMSELRDSGAIEEDSDVVILLYRDCEQSPEEIDFIIDKNRHGNTGIITYLFIGEEARIASSAKGGKKCAE